MTQFTKNNSNRLDAHLACTKKCASQAMKELGNNQKHRATAPPRNSAGNPFAVNWSPSFVARPRATILQSPPAVAGVPSANLWPQAMVEGVQSAIEGTPSAVAWFPPTIPWSPSTAERRPSTARWLQSIVNRRQPAFIHAIFAKNPAFSSISD